MADIPQSNNRIIDQHLLQALNMWQTLKDGIGPYDMTGNGTQGMGGVNSLFGEDYIKDAINDPSVRAKYYPTPGETYDNWIKRLDDQLPGFGVIVSGQQQAKSQPDPFRSNTDQNEFVKRLDGLRQKVAEEKDPATKARGEAALAAWDKLHSTSDMTGFRKAAGFADPNNLGQSENVDGKPTEASGVDIMKAFGANLLKPLDPNDPYVQQLTKIASSSGARQAANQGLDGNIAVANSQQSVSNALMQAQNQRQQLGLQAISGAEQIGLSQTQQAQTAYNNQWQAQMQQLQASYQSRANDNRNLWGTVGGIAGGVIGAYAGGPKGAQMGFTVGSQLAGGLANTGNTAPTLPYAPPSSPGYKPGGG